jgi:hypothetical protein
MPTLRRGLTPVARRFWLQNPLLGVPVVHTSSGFRTHAALRLRYETQRVVHHSMHLPVAYVLAGRLLIAVPVASRAMWDSW